MSDDSSYSLAEGFVVEQIDDALRDEVIREGTTIDVGDMQDCDCIPIRVKDCRGRKWDFDSAAAEKFSTKITARYQSRMEL